MKRKTKCLCGTEFEVEQPEPACFVAPIELDGDPPRAWASVPFLLWCMAFVVAAVLVLFASSCAPSSAYRPTTSYRACSAACERIGCSRHEVETACGPLRRFPV